MPQGDLAGSSHAALLAGHERLLICLDAVAAEQPAPAIDEALVELTKARNDILAQQAQPEAQDASTAAPQSVADLEEIDPELIDIFFEEAEEILTDMDQSLGQWQDDRDNSVHLENLLRGLHTLKGGARLSRLGGIGDMAHDYESELIQLQESNKTVTDDDLADIQVRYDELAKCVSLAQHGDPEAGGSDTS